MHSASLWTRLVYSLVLAAGGLLPFFAALATTNAMRHGRGLGLISTFVLLLPALAALYRMGAVLSRPATLDCPAMPGGPAWLRTLGFIGMHLVLAAILLNGVRLLLRILSGIPVTTLDSLLVMASLAGLGGMGLTMLMMYEMGRLLAFEKALRQS
jgi:hypothetical protein